jgi:hypothetical protein
MGAYVVAHSLQQPNRIDDGRTCEYVVAVVIFKHCSLFIIFFCYCLDAPRGRPLSRFAESRPVCYYNANVTGKRKHNPVYIFVAEIRLVHGG